MSRAVKRLICRIVGHRVTRVSATGPRRYHSHPAGERIACRRCRRVLTQDTP